MQKTQPTQDPALTTTVQQPASWVNDLFQDWLTEHIDDFIDYVLGVEGIRLEAHSEPGAFVLTRSERPFVSPFWGSTWIEATHRAAATIGRVDRPVHLEVGHGFLFDDQLYVLKNKDGANGLPTAHLAGHETGALYVFHPDELPMRAATGVEIGEAYHRRAERILSQQKQPKTVRVPIEDSSTFHRVDGNGYVAIGNKDSMSIDTAQTGFHHGHQDVYPELILYSKNDRRRIAVCMNIDDWMQAIGRLLDRIKKYERAPK